MSGRVVKTRTVARDLEEAAEYLRKQTSPDRAIRFLDEADATFERLASMPGLGARFDPDSPALGELRFFPVSRFRNHIVFYRPVEGGIEVLRVLHGARDIQGVLDEEFGDDEA